jgi:hypothetical protein
MSRKPIRPLLPRFATLPIIKTVTPKLRADLAEPSDRIRSLEPGLVVFKIYNGYWFFGRPTVEDLRHDLRAVSKKCRPDWDITSPELIVAWNQGDKARFYPYGKSYARVFADRE